MDTQIYKVPKMWKKADMIPMYDGYHINTNFMVKLISKLEKFADKNDLFIDFVKQDEFDNLSTPKQIYYRNVDFNGVVSDTFIIGIISDIFGDIAMDDPHFFILDTSPDDLIVLQWRGERYMGMANVILSKGTDDVCNV